MMESKLGNWIPRRLGKVRGRGQDLKGARAKVLLMDIGLVILFIKVVA